MAVAWVSDIEGKDETLATNVLTLASVPGSTGNLVVAIIGWRRNSSQTLDAVTYGGNAMTHFGTDIGASGCGVGVWYTVSPAGTEDVVATLNANAIIHGVAHVFSGAEQAGAFGTQATSNGSGTTTATAEVTSDADGLVLDYGMVRVSGVGHAVDASQTERAGQTTSGTIFSKSSTKPGDTGVTMVQTWTNSNDFVHYVIPIIAGEGGEVAAVKTSKRSLMGVG